MHFLFTEAGAFQNNMLILCYRKGGRYCPVSQKAAGNWNTLRDFTDNCENEKK